MLLQLGKPAEVALRHTIVTKGGVTLVLQTPCQCHLTEGDEWGKIIYPSQCINLPGTSLQFVPTASWDDAPLGRNNIIKAGPKQELKK